MVSPGLRGASGAGRLGLGCARFGSITSRLGFRQARDLVETALSAGLFHFDTADIYGQGDSEAWLGRILAGHPHAFVSTKAGQTFSRKMQLIRPLKPVLAPIARNLGALRSGVTAARAKPLATCFEPGYLTARAEGSLRRLRRERLDAFFLHNPNAEVIRRQDVLEALVGMKGAGKVGLIGVSADDEATIALALEQWPLDLIQAPLALLDFRPELGRLAEARGVGIVAREILGGLAGAAADPPGPEMAKARIINALGMTGVISVLVGTTRKDRLLDAAAAAVAAP